MTGTSEETTEAGTPAAVNAAETEDVSSGGLTRLAIGKGTVEATSWDFDSIIPVTSRVESMAGRLESATAVLNEDVRVLCGAGIEISVPAVVVASPASASEDTLFEIDATEGRLEEFPCKVDDVELDSECTVLNGTVVDPSGVLCVELAVPTAVSGYVGACSRAEVDKALW